MAFTIFFSWWYGRGWKNAFYQASNRVSRLAQELSMPILVATLFEPWKQITSYSRPNSPINIKIRVFFDNVFARIVGFIIRTAVLLFGVVACAVVFLGGVIFAILWPAVPLLPILLIVFTVAGL